MDIVFNNFLIINNKGELQYSYHQNDSINFEKDGIFHLTVNLICKNQPMYIYYRYVHHFIQKLFDNKIIDIAFTSDVKLSKYIQDQILNKISNLELEGTLFQISSNHDLLDEIIPQIGSNVTEQIYNIIDQEYPQDGINKRYKAIGFDY